MAYLLLFGLLVLPFSSALSKVPYRNFNDVRVRQVTPAGQYADNPHWDQRGQALYYADVTKQTINRYDPVANNFSSLYIGGGLQAVVLTTQNRNQFIITRGLDVAELIWDGFSQRGLLRVLVSLRENTPNNRFDDGKADAYGRLWTGTNSLSKNGNPSTSIGTLYSISSQDYYLPQAQISGRTISNGISWNRDNTLLYFTDSVNRKIAAYDFDLQRGTLGYGRYVFDFDQYGIRGIPTGVAVDENGFLWVVVFDGGRVIQINPSNGVLVRSISLPVTQVTNCAWGGRDLSTLYVSSVRDSLPNGQPSSSGAVFAIDGLGTRGFRRPNTVDGPSQYYNRRSGGQQRPIVVGAALGACSD